MQQQCSSIRIGLVELPYAQLVPSNRPHRPSCLPSGIYPLLPASRFCFPCLLCPIQSVYQNLIWFPLHTYIHTYLHLRSHTPHSPHTLSESDCLDAIFNSSYYTTYIIIPRDQIHWALLHCLKPLYISTYHINRLGRRTCHIHPVD